jgi:hypothetical protein
MYAYTYVNVTRDHTTLVIGSNQASVQRHRAESRESWERPGLVSYLTRKNIDNLRCVCGDSMAIINLDDLIPKDQPQVEED